jgi:RNA polymerase sigma-70 factor (ECF subfamily)
MTLASESSEFDLRLEAARAGDDAGWRWLFRLISGRVVAFLVTRGAPNAEDVASETFLDIVRSIRRFSGGERDFVSWSLSIAHRRLVDAHRTSSRRRETMTDPAELEHTASDDVEEAALGVVEATKAKQLFDHLTADQAAVIALRIYGELTLPEIAHSLNKPLTAVTSLQHRGLERLRRLLADPGEALAR